jgi:hypothetical protein
MMQPRRAALRSGTRGPGSRGFLSPVGPGAVFWHGGQARSVRRTTRVASRITAPSNKWMQLTRSAQVRHRGPCS